ncbi:MAG: class I SAM-dependent methyltransferase [Solirubrobacteraceae bacterium]
MASSEPARRATAFTSSSVPEGYERHLAPVLFKPWAEVLVDSVGVQAGAEVLDVASGTGVVARLAAARAGVSGRVVAGDVSGTMLAHAASLPVPAGSAPIEYLEASVTELPLDDGSFDVVLCQQGMPFFTDRGRAAAEMLRVLRPGGVIGLSVWLARRPLEPFDQYIETLLQAGVEPPFPGAFDTETFKMTLAEVEAVLTAGGCVSLEVRAVEREVVWPDAESAALGILGTPFAPLLGQLPRDRRDALEADLARRFAPSAPGEPVRRTTVAVIARATAP